MEDMKETEWDPMADRVWQAYGQIMILLSTPGEEVEQQHMKGIAKLLNAIDTLPEDSPIRQARLHPQLFAWWSELTGSEFIPAVVKECASEEKEGIELISSEVSSSATPSSATPSSATPSSATPSSATPSSATPLADAVERMTVAEQWIVDVQRVVSAYNRATYECIALPFIPLDSSPSNPVWDLMDIVQKAHLGEEAKELRDALEAKQVEADETEAELYDLEAEVKRLRLEVADLRSELTSGNASD